MNQHVRPRREPFFRRLFVATILCAAAFSRRSVRAEEGPTAELGLGAPDGFDVTLYAGDELAHDIYSLTVDSHGRVVVAGRGYVKTLIDRDGDGRADDATIFSDRPRTGARGLYFDGDDLIASGDLGLHRLVDRDADGHADEDTRWLPSRNDGDHAANGVVRGPDGWYYWIAGNDAGIDERHARGERTALRTIVCGALVRVSPDGKTSEVLADGFRNPYDLAFDRSGDVFTYDADGERDEHLPWYSPTRVFDVATGGHHGWILQGWQHAWNRPPYWFDIVDRLVEVGRGSPTGVIVYRHHRFPDRYRDGLFIACWSLGRIYFVPRTQDGAGWRAGLEVFLETKGDTGFAPTDLAVGPEGELYVSIGGRGTRGSVFRVSWRSGGERDRRATESPLANVLAAPEPLSSWSRARWVPRARELGEAAFESAALDPTLPAPKRMRAIEILVELFGGVGVDLARKVLGEPEADLAARALWGLSRSSDSNEARELIARTTRDSRPRVRRAAWEAIVTLPSPLRAGGPAPDFLRAFEDTDDRLRRLAIAAARDRGRELFLKDVPPPDEIDEVRARLASLAASSPAGEGARDGAGLAPWLESARAAFEASRNIDDRLDAARLIEIGLGDVAFAQDEPRVSDGFAARGIEAVALELRQKIARTVTEALPSGDPRLDREISRVLAMLEVEVEVEIDGDGALARIARLFRDDSPAADDVHHLLAAARIPGTRPPEFTARSARALLLLHRKMAREGREPSRFWPVRIAAAFDGLRARDPGLAERLLTDPSFRAPEHALYVDRLRGSERSDGARALLASAIERLEKEGPEALEADTAWVPITGELPAAEWRSLLRSLGSEALLRDAIALVLAQNPEEEDREILTEALGSTRDEIVTAAARGLAKLPRSSHANEIASALLALRSACALADHKASRPALAELISARLGIDPPSAGGEEPRKLFDELVARFREASPAEAAGLDATLGTGAGDWLAKLDGIDWTAGDPRRGEEIFRSRGCHGCHAGSSRLGPDLAGAAARFSRRDLFTAIVDPNRDVSPTHAAKEIVTRRGAVYSGILIYSSPAATLVQVSPDTTVRLTEGEIAEIRDSARSFMPEGLLLGLDDLGIADLDAYLRTLKAQ